MAVELATGYVSLAVSTRDLSKGVDKAGRAAGRTYGSNFGSAAKGFLTGALVVGGLGKLGGVLKESIAGASDLQEAGSKVNQIFGKEGAKAVADFSTGSAKALGQTRLEVVNAAASFGTFGKAAGLGGKDLAKFSTGFAGLATDMASFFNTSPAEATEAIAAGLRGESEPLRKYGVLLDDASMRQEAMRLGLIKTTKTALTPQQKVLAAQGLIYKQTKDAQGDFAKTSGGLANQQRILAAQVSEAKAAIGVGLLPVVTKIVTFMNDRGIPAVAKFAGILRDRFGPALKELASGDNKAKIASTFEAIKSGVEKAFEAIKKIDAVDVGRGIDYVKDTFSTLKPTLDLVGRGFKFVSSHMDLVAKALPFLIAGFAAYKAAQAANNAVGRHSLVGFALQLGSTLSLTLANRALAKSIAGTTLQVAAGTTVENASAVARIRSTAATVAGVVATKAAGVASKLFAAGQWLVNAALTANPIGLVVVAIAALVGGLIYAYKNSETFRNIVNAAFQGVAKVAKAVFAWLSKAVKAVIGFVKSNWKLMVAILGGPIGLAAYAIRKHWGAITDRFRSAVAWVKGAFRAGWNTVKALIMTPVNNAKLGLAIIWDSIKGRFTAVKDWVKSTFKSAWAGIKDIILNPIRNARDTLRTVMGAIKDTFRSAVAAIGTIWDGLKAKAKAPIRFIVNTVINDGLINAFNTIARKVGAGTIDRVSLPKGFARGGWTGPGDRMKPAGIVHADEFVVNKPSRRRIERSNPGALDYMNTHGKLPGYWIGGGVRPVSGGADNSHGSNYYGARWAGDLTAGHGSRVGAWKAGVVSAVRHMTTSYGKHVKVNHGGEQTLYAHLSRIAVNAGQRVRQGQTLGQVGNTGNSFGPHLHFELRGGSGAIGSGKGDSGSGAKDSVVTRIIRWGSRLKDKLSGALGNMKGAGSGAVAELAKGVARKASGALYEKGKNWSQTIVSKIKDAAAGVGDKLKGAVGVGRAGAKRAALKLGATYAAYHSDPSGKPSMDMGVRNISNGNDILGHMKGNRGKYGVEYLIFNKRIYSANRGWGGGSSYYRPASGDHEHTKHVHATFRGYASGTNHATPGLHWVGERGPELLKFRGGEKVINNRQATTATNGAQIHQHFPSSANPQAAANAAGQRAVAALNSRGW